jgi:tetratricopeptide (TPR) repeat protein
MQALFNPSCGHVSVTFAKKGPKDLTETLVGPFEVPLSRAGIAALQSRWLTAQRRFTEAHDFLTDRQSDPDTLADNLLLAARDVAAGGDYQQALTLVARIAPSTPLYEEASRLRTRWQLAHMNAQLNRADALAAQGEFTAALAVLGRLNGDESWKKIKDGRETQWKGALEQREAYKSFKKSELEHQTRAAAEAREAAYAAYRREAVRRYQERQRYQEASRGYRGLRR